MVVICIVCGSFCAYHMCTNFPYSFSMCDNVNLTGAMKNNKEPQGMDQNAKIAEVLMKIEDERNGTGTA